VSPVIVSASFDDLRSRQVRFLQAAAALGPVQVRLWDDAVFTAVHGRPPRFPLAERLYFVQSLRFVHSITAPAESTLPHGAGRGDTWAVLDDTEDRAAFPDPAARGAWCANVGVDLRSFGDGSLGGFPCPPGLDDRQRRPGRAGRPHVMVTGSFDWLHTGHVRFFEEAAALGDLTVIVGHDANLRLLKGEGHPHFAEEERLFMVRSVRSVSRALLSSGHGWLDAEPEIELLRPDSYVVNADGDKPEKAAYCRAHGIEYVVLARAPRDGLPRRSSTDLRGF
jgi:cytidyltransferase-like protein